MAMPFEQVVVINEALGGFCSARGPGGSSIICHRGERELKSMVAARLSLSLTACTVANDIHLLPDRPNSAMTPAAARSDRVQADMIPPALSSHHIVIPPLSLHPSLSSSLPPSSPKWCWFPPTARDWCKSHLHHLNSSARLHQASNRSLPPPHCRL